MRAVSAISSWVSRSRSSRSRPVCPVSSRDAAVMPATELATSCRRVRSCADVPLERADEPLRRHVAVLRGADEPDRRDHEQRGAGHVAADRQHAVPVGLGDGIGQQVGDAEQGHREGEAPRRPRGQPQVAQEQHGEERRTRGGAAPPSRGNDLSRRGRGHRAFDQDQAADADEDGQAEPDLQRVGAPPVSAQARAARRGSRRRRPETTEAIRAARAPGPRARCGSRRTPVPGRSRTRRPRPALPCRRRASPGSRSRATRPPTSRIGIGAQLGDVGGVRVERVRMAAAG